MHASMCCAVAFMLRQQARQEARVQLWRVAFIDRYLRRANSSDETLNELMDLSL
jgi:hypothetical protein